MCLPSQVGYTEGARMDEDTALKAAGCKSFGGSIPSSSAKVKRTVSLRMYNHHRTSKRHTLLKTPRLTEISDRYGVLT